MFCDGFHTLVTERAQLFHQPVTVDPGALGNPASELPDAEWRQEPLGRRVFSHDEQLRVLGLFPECVQRRQALGHRPQRWRCAVVRQAIPGREGQHFYFGREDRNRIRQGPHRCFVGCNQHRPPAVLRPVHSARQVGGENRKEA